LFVICPLTTRASMGLSAQALSPTTT
jgi:hypothetical protein